MHDLPDYIDPEAFQGFIDMRKAKGRRAPFTDRARTLVLNKLAEFHKQGLDVNACLDQATESGWSSVYPIKASVQANPAVGVPVPVKNAALDAHAKRDAELSDPDVRRKADEARRKAIEDARAKIGLRRVA